MPEWEGPGGVATHLGEGPFVTSQKFVFFFPELGLFRQTHCESVAGVKELLHFFHDVTFPP